MRVHRSASVRAERSREHAMGELRAPLVGRDEVLERLRDTTGPTRPGDRPDTVRRATRFERFLDVSG